MVLFQNGSARLLAFLGVCIMGCAFAVSAMNGRINVYGDDVLDFWVDGTQLITQGNRADTIVPINAGNHVFLAKVKNGIWATGYMASLRIGSAYAWPSTNQNWKCALKEPAGWPTAVAAAGMMVPSDLGSLESNGRYDNCEAMLPEELPDFCEWYNWVGYGTHLLWSPDTLCFRKSFTAATAVAGKARFCCISVNAEVYFNGVLIDTILANATQGKVLDVNILAGTNVVAVRTVAMVDTVGQLNGWIFAGDVNDGMTQLAYTDTTWKIGSVSGTDWTGTSFDDAAWGSAGDVCNLRPTVSDGYGAFYYGPASGPHRNMESNPPANPETKFIYAKTVWFRGEVDLPEVGVIHLPGAVRAAGNSVTFRNGMISATSAMKAAGVQVKSVVFNAKGACVRSITQSANGGSVSIDGRNLPAGVYLYRQSVNGKSWSANFTVNR